MTSPADVYGNIPRPTFSSLGIDMFVKGSCGLAVGVLTQSNAKLWAVILCTQSIASLFFYEIGKIVFYETLRCKTVSELARTASYSLAIFTLQQCGLISIQLACLYETVALAFLLARVSWIRTTNPPSKL